MPPARLQALRLHAANDNEERLSDAAIGEALRHFARHGLAAAPQARQAAEAAFRAGDRRNYRHWLAICRALDRRMAGELARATGGTA